MVASSVNYTQDTSWVRSIELHGDTSTGDGEAEARNWLDGIYGEKTTSIKYPVFQPLSYSINYINHNDAYNIAKALTKQGNIYGFTQSVDSHLMKDSEWGACAYLSKSQYGLNTTNITINNINLNSGSKMRTEGTGKNDVDSVYAVTGCAAGSEDAKENIVTIENVNTTTGNADVNGIFTWNQLNGTKASSTGTIYGIYDMSGGLWERTASYIANGNPNLKAYALTLTYGNMNTLKTVSTKYETVYYHNTSYDNTGITSNADNRDVASTNNWLANQLIYGDGVYETSTAGNNKNSSWYQDQSYFLQLYSPLMLRGGDFNSSLQAGFFSFYPNNGYSNSYSGFRVALIIS